MKVRFPALPTDADVDIMKTSVFKAGDKNEWPVVQTEQIVFHQVVSLIW